MAWLLSGHFILAKRLEILTYQMKSLLYKWRERGGGGGGQRCYSDAYTSETS